MTVNKNVKNEEIYFQFLEGLNSLVPDNLLSLFDENELELLISGVRYYKVADLKRFHSVIAGTSSRTVDWFWLALEHFTQGKRESNFKTRFVIILLKLIDLLLQQRYDTCFNDLPI